MDTARCGVNYVEQVKHLSAALRWLPPISFKTCERIVLMAGGRRTEIGHRRHCGTSSRTVYIERLCTTQKRHDLSTRALTDLRKFTLAAEGFRTT